MHNHYKYKTHADKEKARLNSKLSPIVAQLEEQRTRKIKGRRFDSHRGQANFSSECHIA